MLSQFEPNVKATIAFLRFLKVPVNKATVNETLQNHPDWPSLLCISDSLNKWKIQNGAGKINTTDIDQLPVPFIAHTPGRQGHLSVVIAVIENKISYYGGNYNKLIEENKNDFLKKWNGVYLIAEASGNSGEENYKKHRRQYLAGSFVPVTLTAVLISFSFFLFQRTINNYTAISNNIKAGFYFQYLIQLAGVIITSLLLWYEIDKNNPVLQKVCSGIAKGNCNAILTSKEAKVFNWLSWSEIGFFYFSNGLLLLLLDGDIFTSIAIVAGFNILALPYTVFSVYYQWRIAKQWCILCLGVQFLLIIGGINIFSNNLLQLPGLSPSSSMKIALLFATPAFLWFSIKPYVFRLQRAQSINREYHRIKFNEEIFDTLLKKQKQIKSLPDNLGVDIGNRNAENFLIKVCNPYCGPCSQTHKKIEDLLKKNHNLRVKIIYTAPNSEGNIMFNPVRHFLAVAAEEDDEKTKRVLDDWYLTEKKDYAVFSIKYPMKNVLADQGNNIEKMNNWCNEMEIGKTPTLFFNGYQLPDAYSIEDLQYFLLK